MKKYEVCFRYADVYSHWEWRNQKGIIMANDKLEAERKCIRLYGLGVDCDYQIISVREIL